MTDKAALPQGHDLSAGCVMPGAQRDSAWWEPSPGAELPPLSSRSAGILSSGAGDRGAESLPSTWVSAQMEATQPLQPFSGIPPPPAPFSAVTGNPPTGFPSLGLRAPVLSVRLLLTCSDTHCPSCPTGEPHLQFKHIFFCQQNLDLCLKMFVSDETSRVCLGRNNRSLTMHLPFCGSSSHSLPPLRAC